jgi:hypothetical protein
VRIPARSYLLLEPWQGRSVLCTQEVATPGKQATHVYRILRNFVAAHGAIAFFDPPTDGALTGSIGAIERFPFGSFPGAITRQTMPQVPAIQKQQPEAIRKTLMLAFLRW